MKLELSIVGLSRDVNQFISRLKEALPDIHLDDIKVFPGHYNTHNSDIIAMITTLSGFNKNIHGRKYTIVISEDERLEILNALKELKNPYEPEYIPALIAEFENLGGDKR